MSQMWLSNYCKIILSTNLLFVCTYVANLSFKKGVLLTLSVSQDASRKENAHGKGYI